MMRRVAVTLSIAALFLFGSRTAAADKSNFILKHGFERFLRPGS
jgi:hypothetical protein